MRAAANGLATYTGIQEFAKVSMTIRLPNLCFAVLSYSPSVSLGDVGVEIPGPMQPVLPCQAFYRFRAWTEVGF